MSDEAIYVAASGALVQKMRLEILSNNLANINTTGFKEDRAVFSNYLSSEQNGIIDSNPDEISGIALEVFGSDDQSNIQVKFDGTRTDFSQGQLRATGSPLDLALEGKGFFCIQSKDGIEQYTRKGDFKLGDDGKLVTQEGLAVLGRNGGTIQINPNQPNTVSGGQPIISVDENGVVSSGGTEIDSLKIVNFEDPSFLTKIGDSLFSPSESGKTGTEVDGTKIRQGFVEQSNVDPIKVMTELIEVQRAFESYQKILRSMDELLGRSVNEVGKPV
jgi:flagellar basal-body rod protein FlgF